MLGINYASSDDEDELPATGPEVRLSNVHKRVSVATNIKSANVLSPDNGPTAPALTTEPVSGPVLHPKFSADSEPVNGPSQGPSASPPPPESESESAIAPGSPYSSTRAMIQNLTLPAVPNFDIPPSPPGSPSQTATKKFAQFLELKKAGHHFNQRLENSSVLRDPSHLQKLMDFAGISEEDSYASTLSANVAVPIAFPEWAYVEELRASQKRLTKAREQDKSKKPRAVVDFVTATKPNISSGTGIPSRVASSKRKELEHRSREGSSSSGANSPKRRR